MKSYQIHSGGLFLGWFNVEFQHDLPALSPAATNDTRAPQKMVVVIVLVLRITSRAGIYDWILEGYWLLKFALLPTFFGIATDQNITKETMRESSIAGGNLPLNPILSILHLQLYNYCSDMAIFHCYLR